MPLTEGPSSRAPEGPLHLAVARARRITPPEGIRVVRTDRLRDQVLWNLGPPRMRYDEAAIDVAAQAGSDFSALSVLSRAAQSRRATAGRMLGGLHADRRQAVDRLGGGSIYRDVLYRCGVIVELDGRLFPDTSAQRDHDVDRDLDAAAGGAQTVRLSCGQVFDRPCWTRTADRSGAATLRLERPSGAVRPGGRSRSGGHCWRTRWVTDTTMSAGFGRRAARPG